MNKEKIDCKVCGSLSNVVFRKKILNKYDVNYYQCTNCGYLCTETPYWIDEAYQESIVKSDTGIMKRNIKNLKVVNMICSLYFDRKLKFLDFGGGYGVFTRMMRDLGWDFFWQDKFSENLLSKGFENDKSGMQTSGGYGCITCFEVLEHCDNPIAEFNELLKRTKNIIASTEIYDKNINLPNMDWWYLGCYSGQHISFYSELTFKYIAQKYQLNYYRLGSYHLLLE